MTARRTFAVAGIFALVLIGTAVAAPLPGATTARDRAAWRAILHWPAQCESGWRATREPGAGLQIMPTATGSRLVAVECYPGAYQGDAMLYLVESHSKAVGPLGLRVFVDPGNGHPRLERSTTILGNLNLTASTGKLTVFDEYRGLGDCGIFATYRLEQASLVLIAARAKTACNGKPPVSPQRWPKLAIPS